MTERKKRNTAPVVIGDDFHKAMRLYFKKAKVPRRYQVEFALKEYYKEKAPDIFMILINKEKENEKRS
jgi:hypothetical protein